MDGNCNIITEILLVIIYTRPTTAQSNVITVTSYCGDESEAFGSICSF